ncbi:hypothetical protein LNQ52_20530 [Klebsiella pneumoniae subsp. pneumoniae]|nr:hypothetical protein [Klebsiella pneumoniae subsp. pneumoniae]
MPSALRGYVEAHWKSASSAKTRWRSRRVVVASGSAGHGRTGLAVGLEQLIAAGGTD